MIGRFFTIVCATYIALTGTAAADVQVFGIQAPAFGTATASPGAFIPAGTELSCAALSKDGRCWDGKRWHRLFPNGSRHYRHANGAKVACIVIVNPEADCWTGDAWYRLPHGQLYGIVAPSQGGINGEPPGAFITTPLD
jgi:hypothetical protein